LSEYGKYFLTSADGIIQPGINVAKELRIIKADKGVLGLDFGIGWYPVTHSFKMIHEPHEHDYAQISAFIPGDIAQSGKLDAEMESYIAGEKHIITDTTVVVIPGGVVQCPQYINRIGKPFIFNNIYFTIHRVESRNKQINRNYKIIP
jgi:hypothetical protein